MEYITIPNRATDITRRRFARLVVLGPVAKDVSNQIKWLCQCDCGGTTITTITMLRSGHTKSCGCWRNESRLTQAIKHGKSNSKTYIAWRNMIGRCCRVTDHAYPQYGGRGITIYPQWRDSFEDFEFYVAQLPHYEESGYTLDRIDNNGNYEPGNVRWATAIEQNRNRRRHRLITFNGKTQCSSAWAEETGISRRAIQHRLNNGWDVEKTLTTPSRSRNAAKYLVTER